MSVRLSSHFGIVIRKESLARAAIPSDRLLQAMEAAAPIDEDSTLVSFGPHFGQEAADEFGRRLALLGLKYPDDFFVIDFLVPEWLSLSGAFVRET